MSQLEIDIKARIRQLVDEAEIKIIHPLDRDEAKASIQVIGSCKNLPEGFKICVFTISAQHQEVGYRPRRYLAVKNQQWKAVIDIRDGKPGERKKFGVFLVGKDGQALIKQFFAVGRQIPPDQPWPPITQFTNDIIECETREVIIMS